MSRNMSLSAVRSHLAPRGVIVTGAEPYADGRARFVVHRRGARDDGYYAQDPEHAYLLAIKHLL